MEHISIGAGIFYGLLALSFVILIVKTRDRWKWGRIFAGIIGLPILAIGVIMGIEYYDYMPKSTSEFAGLTLNMTVDEVRFLKGEPYRKVKQTRKVGTTLLLYPIEDASGELFITCADERVRQIVIVGDSIYAGSLYGIYLGLDYQDAIDKLGDSFQVKNHSEFYRSLYYKKYNIVIGFYQGKVNQVGIAIDPEKYGWLKITPNE
jgi:hypothetical protein